MVENQSPKYELNGGNDLNIIINPKYRTVSFRNRTIKSRHRISAIETEVSTLGMIFI